MTNLRALRPSLVLLIALGAGCATEAGEPACPSGTIDFGGLCKRGCTSDTECLGTESCDLASGVCKKKTTPPPPPPPGPAPVISRFWVAPEMITTPGQRVMIFYEVTDATEVEIAPNALARTSVLSQTIEVQVQDTTTFTLTAYGEGETSAERTVVLMGGTVGIPVFTATPELAHSGDLVKVAWRVVNAAPGTIRISDPYGRRWLMNGAAAEGELSDTPPSLPTEYWIEATGENGLTVRASAAVLPAAEGPHVVTFDAEPAAIALGDTALLRWETAGAAALSLQGGNLMVAAHDPMEVARGFALVAPESSTDYGITITDGQQTASQRTQLEVTQAMPGVAPELTSFSVEPGRRSQLSPSNNLTVRWEAANADHVDLYANGALVGTFGTSDRRTVPATTPENVKLSLVADAQGTLAEADFTAYYVVGEAEPNDSPQQADGVDSVGRLGLVVSQQIDLDWYSIMVEEGGRIDATLAARQNQSCEALRGLVFELVGPDATTVEDSGAPDANGCPHIAIEHLGSGTHYLRVGAGSMPLDGAEYVLLASAFSARCGDGVAEGREQCDDGNRAPGDGCDAQCVWESELGYDVARRAIQSLPPVLAPPVPVRLEGTGEDRSAVLPLATPFSFYGHRYAGVVVHSSGYLTFRPAPEDAGAPRPIPAGDLPNAVIAALWGPVKLADFSDARGEILYWPRGVDTQAAHPRFDLWFHNLTGRGHTEESHALVDVVVSLEEDTNIVRIFYGAPKVVGQAQGFSFVAGIEDADGALGEVVPGCSPGCDAQSNPAGQLVTFTPR